MNAIDGDPATGWSTAGDHGDVPSELAARHDAAVAIHREFAETGIVIAFPQVVVWTGHSERSALYEDRLTRIHTALPVAAPRQRRGRKGMRIRRTAQDKKDPT